MHDNFIALAREKRDRIINAAMGEFAAKGFDNASTNEIVKAACISKGALFHYFASKLDLFQFLYDYGVDVAEEIMGRAMEDMSADVFERWVLISVTEMKIAAQYPELSAFMLAAAKETSSEAQAFVQQRTNRFSQNFVEKIYAGIDMTKFKPEVDAGKVLKIIMWVLEGFAAMKLKETVSPAMLYDDSYMREMTDEEMVYLNLIKQAVYKEEFL